MATNPQKKHLTFTIRDFYKNYRKACKESGIEPREYKQYKAYFLDFFAEVFRKILHEFWHFRLPYGCGELYIRESDGNTKLDINHWRKTGERRLLQNLHTFGRTYKLKWDKSYTLFDTLKYLKFKIARGDSTQSLKYKVGSKAMSDHLFEISKDPTKKLKRAYNHPMYKNR